MFGSHFNPRLPLVVGRLVRFFPPGLLKKSQIQWLFLGSRKRWAWWHIIPPIGSIYHLYTTYILPSVGLNMVPTTFYGNQKQPLTNVCFTKRCTLTTPQKIKMSLKRESFQKERLVFEPNYFAQGFREVKTMGKKPCLPAWKLFAFCLHVSTAPC